MDVTSYLLGKQAGGGGGQPSLQNKSVTITENGTQNVTADAGYDGLRNVGITTDVQPSLQNKSLTISENTTTSISADSGYDGLDTVSVTTNVQPNLETKSVTITENTTTTITPTTGKDGLSSVEVITNVSGGGSTPTNITELNNILSDFDNYLDTLVDNYTAYLDEPITIYTPNENSTSFMIQKRSNGKYRIVWSNYAYYLCLVSNSSQSFAHRYTDNNYSEFSTPLTLSTDADGSRVIYGYYSVEFNTLEDLLLAIQNQNGSGISYSLYQGGIGYSGVLDSTWITPISNLPVFNSDKITPFINGKVLSHNTTILPINDN